MRDQHLKKVFDLSGVNSGEWQMDINTNSIPSQTGSAITGTPLLKKAIALQGQSALTLVNSIQPLRQTSAANLPSNLGQNINTTA